MHGQAGGRARQKRCNTAASSWRSLAPSSRLRRRPSCASLSPPALSAPASASRYCSRAPPLAMATLRGQRQVKVSKDCMSCDMHTKDIHT